MLVGHCRGLPRLQRAGQVCRAAHLYTWKSRTSALCLLLAALACWSAGDGFSGVEDTMTRASSWPLSTARRAPRTKACILLPPRSPAVRLPGPLSGCLARCAGASNALPSRCQGVYLTGAGRAAVCITSTLGFPA